MISLRRSILVVAAGALMGAAPAVATRALAGRTAANCHLTSSIIVPGRSIGNLKIGMTIQQVARYLGPGQLLSKHLGVVSYYLYGTRVSGEYTVLYAGHPRTAVAIGERTGVMHTVSGIRLGSSLAEIQGAYAVQCGTSIKEASTEVNASGYCDLHGPTGRATRFTVRNGEVETIGVAKSRWLSQLK